jgi:hypothetical protein
MDKKKKHLEVRSVPKTYRVTQEMNQEIRAAANWFGCTDTMIIDIALLNFLSLSIEGRQKMLARYHLLRSQFLGLEESEASEANILRSAGRGFEPLHA